MERATLADEVAAEIELALPDTARRTSKRLQRLSEVAAQLAREGLRRQLLVNPQDSTHLEMVGISTARSSIPAFGGLLYGTSALAHGVRLRRTDVLDAWQISRIGVGDIDHFGSNERIRWQQLLRVYEVLEALLAQGRPQIVLLDLPLFVSRREEATVSEDKMIAAEWAELESRVNAFWTEHLREIYPFCPDGFVIASLRSHSATSLFSALLGNANTTPDPIDQELVGYLQKEWVVLRQLGQSRLLDRVLLPSSRSIAYSYEDLDLDPRWQPRELHHVGILGLFMRARRRTGIWHIQVPGHRTQWSSEILDTLAVDIIRATLFDDDSALPLPLWYAKELVRFPRQLLLAYRKCIEEELSEYG